MADVKTEPIPLLPLHNGVVLPQMVVTIPIEREEARAAIAAAREGDRLVLLVPRVEGRFANLGTVARLEDSRRVGNVEVAVLQGLYRASLGSAAGGTGPALRVMAQPATDVHDHIEHARLLSIVYKALIENLLYLRVADQVFQMVRSIDQPSHLADLAGYSPDLSLERKVEILETLDVEARLKKLIEWTRDILAEASLKDKIRSEVESGMEKRQREFLLRQQLDAIKKELGEQDSDVAAEYRRKIEEAGMPDAVRQEVERELSRFERMSEQNPEQGRIRNYLDWMMDLPWIKRTGDRVDVVEARPMLDAIDKVGSDWRGDPSSALLEVHDPAQNHSFRDHYLEVDLDLSEVLFIPTANVSDTIPAPLLDRMEIVRLDGYTEEEKLAIARDHLMARQLERNGLTADEVSASDEALRAVIADHTREAGVRNLERELGRLLRKIATGIESGNLTAPVEIGPAHVREHLGRAKFHAEVAERTSVPGVAT